MQYNLEERTINFSKKIILLCKKVPKNTITTPLINQVLRAGTSIGANYTEANGASSKRDFKNKIFICKKEAMETKYWLRIIADTCKEFMQECQTLWKEAHELTLIFSKIASKSN